MTHGESPGEPRLVAFQGEPGAYSEMAARRALGESIETLPCRVFKDVFDAVVEGRCDLGVLPIENSTAGTITETFDRLLDSGLRIIGESYLPIEHCLIIRPGATLEGVTRVLSHPQALAQCRGRIEAAGLVAQPVEDTAGAAKWLAQEGADTDAVLASALASELYGLEVAIAGAQDEAANTTRFLVVSPEPSEPLPGREDAGWKTSLALELGHVPGALYRALGLFAERDINLTKLESRPIPERTWEYRFYVDFDGELGAELVEDCLSKIRDLAVRCRILGCYRSAR